jgi:hypothetical protein
MRVFQMAKEGNMKIKGQSGTPDLQTQLESLFDQVWRSEDDWQLWDRIDAAAVQDALRTQRASRATTHPAADTEPGDG